MILNHFRHRIFNIAALLCFIYAFASFVLFQIYETQILGTNVFIKPLKFGLSAGILFLTFSWYANFIPNRLSKPYSLFAWVNVWVMTFELSWILIQATRGTLSHFNTNTVFESIMFGLMGIFIAISTTWTLVLFRWTFLTDFTMRPGLIWALRFGILYFVFFGFAGFIMGANRAHTIGAADGGPGLPFFNWSLTHGDVRIPHFLGLHALQILPLASWIFNLRLSVSFIISILYGLICFFLLYLALNGIAPY